MQRHSFKIVFVIFLVIFSFSEKSVSYDEFTTLVSQQNNQNLNNNSNMNPNLEHNDDNLSVEPIDVTDTNVIVNLDTNNAQLLQMYQQLQAQAQAQSQSQSQAQAAAHSSSRLRCEHCPGAGRSVRGRRTG